jgi:hypothetical protein
MSDLVLGGLWSWIFVPPFQWGELLYTDPSADSFAVLNPEEALSSAASPVLPKTELSDRTEWELIICFWIYSVETFPYTLCDSSAY